MTDKKIREAEFTRQHTISPDQFKQLIKDKMDRAKQYYDAKLVKREVLKGTVRIAKCE